jgi:hypothetical protein
MVAVVAGSIKFTMPDAGLEGRRPRPDLFMNSSHVVCHLSHGFNAGGVPSNEFGSVNNGSIDRAISEAAWRAKAEFRLDTSDAAEIAKFEFGFIQIMFDGQFLMQYAGAKPQLGSLSIQPDFQNAFYLDSNPTHTPWTLPPADREILIGDRIICFTGDHPAFLAKRRTENFHRSFGDSAAIDNHFQFISHSMHFITVLAQFEKKTLAVQALASFRWQLKYQFEVKYLNGTPIIRNASTIKFDPAAKIGDPGFNGDEKKIFDSRSGLFFNTVAPGRYRAALQKGSSARTESDTWFLSVPKDFFVGK